MSEAAQSADQMVMIGRYWISRMFLNFLEMYCLFVLFVQTNRKGREHLLETGLVLSDLFNIPNIDPRK
jgi:hypothetical protein